MWIKRLGKWDLPKGKIENDESFPDAAEREIEEETGICAKTTAFLGSTFHTYTLGEKFILKETKWYILSLTEHFQKTNPQTEEGITEAAWLTNQEVENILSETYDSIRNIWQAYLKATRQE